MNIIKNRNIYIAISIIIIVIGFGFMLYNNSQDKGFFNYDIQFTGGTSIEANIGQGVENEDINDIVKNTLGIDNARIQIIGDGKGFIIKMRLLTQEERLSLTEALIDKYNLTDDNFSVRDISATISNEMKRNSFIAIAVSCIVMLIYVSLRFKDWKIGISTIIALLHDALIVLTFYAIFRIPLNEAFIAAILTVIGYSINATIVIFDRIRENRLKRHGVALEEIVNSSISQSLRRSIFTSLTTFFTVIALYIFGVETVKVFALPIAIGIICGTYSSICIAGSIFYMFSNIKKSN